MDLLFKCLLLYITTLLSSGSCGSGSKDGIEGSGQSVTVDSTVIRFFQQNKAGDGHWVASDGAISIPLSNGKVLWTMGDSHIGDYDPATGTIPCLFQVRNCLLVQQAGDWHNVQTHIGSRQGIKSFFKNTDADSTWFWPAHGFEWQGFVYIYLTELRRIGGGVFGFGSTGKHYLAKTNIQTMQVESYQLLPDFGKIDYTLGFIKESEQPYFYAFGQSAGLIESNIHVARIDLSNNFNWTFWDGGTWVNNASRSATITTGASNGTAIQRYRDKYVLLSAEFSVGCDQGKQLFAATASSPTGPFTERKAIYTITDTLNGHYPFWYTPAIHPQYANDKGVLVTYCINGYGNCESACINGRSNPDHYRPKAVRVPYNVLP